MAVGGLTTRCRVERQRSLVQRIIKSPRFTVERAVDDRHWNPAALVVHNLKTANIVVAVQQRHHAEVAMRSGAQLPG